MPARVITLCKMNGFMRPAWAWVLALVLSVAGPALAQPPEVAGDAAAQAANGSEQIPGITPRQLLEAVPERLALFSGESSLPQLREFPLEDRAAATRAAVSWVHEILAPLELQDECRTLLSAVGYTLPESVPRVDARPVAEAPDAHRLWVPDRVAPLSKQDIELLQGTGLLPVEVALAGEWARFAAARHTGPALKDPLLRLARAARLEGVARLAGLTVVLTGSGLTPDDVGAGLLKTDKDRAGVSRSLVADWNHPLDRAMAQVFFEDGLRWALFHYLRGGAEELAAALERPGTGPQSLLRPGARRAAPDGAPPGCALGPRGAAAVLVGDPGAFWVDSLVRDSLAVRDGAILSWLGFESETAARNAQSALERRGLTVQVQGRVVIARRTLNAGG